MRHSEPGRRVNDVGNDNVSKTDRFIQVAVGSLLTGVTLGFSGMANAIVKDVSATFRPDPTKPHENKFKNTTPNEGYCLRYPIGCEQQNIFSLQLPIKFNSNAPIPANHTDPRKGAMFKVPSSWRSLQIVNEQTGEAETVEIRIAGIGVLWFTKQSVSELVGGGVDWTDAHGMLWEGSYWSYPPPGCGYSGSADWGLFHYAAFWLVPADTVCAKKAKYLIPEFRYDYLDFAYEMRTPNPLAMSSGTYSGSMNYTLGPHQDFDMGDVMLTDESIVTLDFKLRVDHTLKVEVPPGGNRVELEPLGGWQSWLQQGRKPTRLFKDQTFNISASSRFKMKLECSPAASGNCQLSDGLRVQLLTSVSLPHGLTDANGQTVDRRLLSTNEQPVFQPGFYVDRKPGTLHFEVLPHHVAAMIQPGQPKQFSAQVTIIWDSEV